MIETNIQRNGLDVPLADETIRRLAALSVPDAWHAGGAVDITFVDDATIARANERFLSHAGPTDVIAFPLEDDVPEEGDRTLGDILVSVDTAQRESARRGVPLPDELALYVVHGLLHLAGYDDLSPEPRKAMHAREREVMTEAGLPYVR